MRGAARFQETDTVSFERQAPCTVEAAWRAVTEPEALGRWFIPTRVDFREGGRFEFEDAWGGTVTGIETHRSVTYAADRGGATTFEISGHPEGARIVMTDRMGPKELPPDGYSERSSYQPGGPGTHWAGVMAGWHGFMDALVRHLGGEPPETDTEALTERYAEALRARFTD